MILFGRFSRYFMYLRPIFKHVKNSLPVMFFLGFIFILVATWWLGPKWEVGGEYPLAGVMPRTLITVIVLLIATIGFVVFYRRSLKKSEEQRRKDKAEEVDPGQIYIDAQERGFTRLLALLKENISSKFYLYKLPWYLVIGAEDSGKTSLINRSGQNFSLTTVTKAGDKSRSVRRRSDTVELPFKFEWWISNDAVLIDPDGKLMTQNQLEVQDHDEEGFLLESGRAGDTDSSLTSRLWDHFVEWIGNTRSRRPLNGAILTVDISKLMHQKASERKAYAAVLRTRLREIMEKTGTRLPVYLVLSKFDLVEGFNTFFHNLPKARRDLPMGFTFSMDALNEYDKWLDEFDVHYRRFTHNLSEQSFDQMATANSQEERNELFSFTRQMAGIKNTLQEFLAELLESDQYSTAALVRGVYFTSVYQHGIPVNAFVDAAAKNYLVPLMPPRALEQARSRTYFSNRLFSQIIYPEAGLAGDNTRLLKKKRTVMMTTSIVASLGVAILVGGWQHYYKHNKDSAVEVLSYTKAFTETEIKDVLDTSGRNLLEPLNYIRKAATVYGPYRDRFPVVADLGLYQGRIIGPKVDESYLKLLEKRFLPELGTGAIDEINDANARLRQKNLSEEQMLQIDDKKFRALRVYRMIEDKENRRNEMVEEWMAERWQNLFTEERDVRHQLMGHLEYAMDYVDADLPEFKNLVSATQRDLLRIPVSDRVYRNMKHNAERDLITPLDLRNYIGPLFDIVYDHETERGDKRYLRKTSYQKNAKDNAMDYKIPALLTKKGFKKYFVSKSENIVDLALVDSWVLGLRDQLDYVDKDKTQLKKELRKLYIKDYVKTWTRAINNLEIRRFEDIPHAVTVLQSLNQKNSPIRRLLMAIQEHSVVYNLSGDTQVAANEALLTDPDRNASLGITKAFAPLNKLLESSDDKAPYIDEVFKSLALLTEYMNNVKEATDMGKASLDASYERLSLKGTDPIYNLRRIANGLPAPLNKQLADIANESWRVLLARALRELENKWDTEVYSYYAQNLANKYPLNSAGADASLEDFERFFSPDGILDSFNKKYLKLFFEDNYAELQTERGGDPVVRSEVTLQLGKIEDIQNSFFNNKGVLHVPFTIEPLALAGGFRRSVLYIEGQTVPYNNGSSYPIEMIWPNTLSRGTESKLVMVSNGGVSKTIRYRGPWSWFRLFNRGQIKGVSKTRVDIGFYVDGGVMRYRLRSPRSQNPLSSRLLKGFVLPRTLLSTRPVPLQKVSNVKWREAYD